MHALILGGTAEARELARLMMGQGWWVTSSLAGRVANPHLPVGEVRIGGFGGPAGLARWIFDNDIEVIIDATHPFAEKISTSAAEAALATGVPLISLHRKPWEPVPGDRWLPVASMDEAASIAARDYHHIFLTIGRQQLAPFARDPHNLYVIRCVEKPTAPLPARHRLILSRGPFDVAGEKELMVGNQIDCLVTKNSGGQLTAAKLEAARSLGIPVVMVERPPLPGGSRAVVAHTPVEVLRLLREM
ncbi:cobalt-precorrin-6A reductase [Corynebacterium epidermidicanis]|uniref:Precorrin-6x reductase n=1 Tax=Corynebacterium epidermidicanis TaxID=1050174 RepID=A0A0G3GPM0_9CORY|nr:cobalt-precorrin-6A reductase [Corynebacterium epidermidicanis]AKK03126.1 precorrin-6x reductase [Corynebacterium epidermidicanis]